MSELHDTTERAEVPLSLGMDTHLGRVLRVDELSVLVWRDDQVQTYEATVPVANLNDPATYLMGLAILAARTGLEPGNGVLWYLNEDDGDRAWVLEGTDEVRTRDADTLDPFLSLARGLLETL